MAEIKRMRNWVRRKPQNWVKHILPAMQGPVPKRLLEIGVFEGLSAQWWLDNLLTGPNDFYLGIDPWDSKVMNHIFRHQTVMDEVHENANLTVAPYGKKAKLFHGTSVEAFRPAEEIKHLLGPESFDVGYIDGEHEPPGAMWDSVNVWPLIRPGGIIVWDDWGGTEEGGRRPLPVFLRNFFDLIEGRYEVLWETNQFGIRKVR